MYTKKSKNVYVEKPWFLILIFAVGAIRADGRVMVFVWTSVSVAVIFLQMSRITCHITQLLQHYLRTFQDAIWRVQKMTWSLIFAIQLKFFPLFQTSASLKAFFPQSPPSLLIPLFTMPSGQCAHTSSLRLSALTPGKNAQNSPVWVIV